MILASVLLTAMLAAPAWATKTALPGTLNYVEGNASIGSQTLNSNAVGSVELQPGQSLTTENGKAEVLLTPGVFLRIGDNSSVTLVSPDLLDTQIAVNKGEVMVEVDQLHQQNNIRVREDGVNTRVVKSGLYDFDADQNSVRVFDGKAVVQEGDRKVTIKGGHELALNATKTKKFDKHASEQSELYRWSSLRSSYLAEANVDAARSYEVNGWAGAGFMGGWYWDPWFSSYTFMPGGGYLYSPFGWGFYSPMWVYQSPVIVGGGFYRHFGAGYRPVYSARGRFAARGPVAGSRGGLRGGNVQHSAPAMRSPSRMGGFGGGFHGGGVHSAGRR
jgi:hypothetical protein